MLLLLFSIAFDGQMMCLYDTQACKHLRTACWCSCFHHWALPKACIAGDKQCHHLPHQLCQPTQHVTPVGIFRPACCIPTRRLECFHQSTDAGQTSRPVVKFSMSACNCCCGSCACNNSSQCSCGSQGNWLQQTEDAPAELGSLACRQASNWHAGLSQKGNVDSFTFAVLHPLGRVLQASAHWQSQN